MRKTKYSVLPFILLLGSWMSFLPSCTRPLPLPPTPAPTPTSTPSCGFNDLGKVICAAPVMGLTIIRDLAAWSAFTAGTTCPGSSASPVPDFTTEMVLVHSSEVGQESFHYSTVVESACLYSDRLEVSLRSTYQLAIMAPSVIGTCFCKNKAVAVPATTLPVHFTLCDDVLNLSTLVSSNCALAIH